ncbi:hypothetical protein E6W39_07955 [Kitasatospora acidiphila]|uniref:PH domain-containing protein n=1 Tax=Kitasatospora acidiphila TaxID=2567942 RepID=A0A540VZL4_9ACTN|nr:hypothetical protein [Kitasatospora acidiphila]TQF02215.1 hypothetical protein E6W39_07955 [Kitasatospora acidiphila]
MARTGPGAVGPAAVGPPSQTVPSAVDQLARAHRLGELTDVRRGVSPLRVVAVGWGSAVVALLLTVLMGHEAAGTTAFTPAGSALHALSIAFLFIFAAGTAYGLRGLLAGSRALYLYDGGLVHADRSGARAVPWSEIAGLRGIHQQPAGQGATGRLLGYRLLTRSGTSFVIPRIPADGHDPFTDRIVDAARRHHRPII